MQNTSKVLRIDWAVWNISCGCQVIFLLLGGNACPVLTLHPIGILGEDDEDDLGEIERRLSEKHRESAGAASSPNSPSQAPSGHGTPQTGFTSPEPGAKDKDKDKEEKRRSIDPASAEEEKQDSEEVSALSEMMSSLVTNQFGETRYIGKFWSSVQLRNHVLVSILC